MERKTILTILAIFIALVTFFTIGGCLANAGTLTFDSSPDSGVYITITNPAQDLDGKGSGNGPITRRYSPGTNVYFQVSTSYNNKIFAKWTKDGADYSVQNYTYTTVDSSNHHLVAIYQPPGSTLTVQSSPDSGVPITVSPADKNSQGSGNTPFTRSYNPNTVVNLTAPSSYNGKPFKQWNIDGAPYSSLTSTSVTMNIDHTLTAVYYDQPPVTLTVQSSPDSGVLITVSPTDRNSQGDGNTSFTRSYSPNIVVNLTAPPTFSGKNFKQWNVGGSFYLSNQSIQVMMDAAKTVAAVYEQPSGTLTLNSSPDSGVYITITNPAQDLDGKGSGNGQITRRYSVGTNVYFQVSISYNNKVFVKWTKDGVDYSSQNSTYATVDSSNHTFLAVYVTPTPIATLTVQSSPYSGVQITVGPTDNNGQGNGNTTFTRTYNANAVVNLTAPSSYNGRDFKQWNIDGAPYSSLTSTSVTMNIDHTLTAVYYDQPPVTLTVQSSPDSGVLITVSPTDRNSQGDGNTSFTRSYSPNIVVNLTAPPTFSGKNFKQWNVGGSFYSSNQSIQVTMDASKTATAVYEQLSGTLTFDSSPDSGVYITITNPAQDLDGKGSGNGPITRRYSPGTNVYFQVSTSYNNKIFAKWTKDGADYSVQNYTYTTVDSSNHHLVAIYQPPGSTLTVQSSPDSGVPITVSPADKNSQGSGNTPFTRSYNPNTVVNLTAPSSYNGKPFKQWNIDGAPYSSLTSTSVTMNIDHTLTAVYEALPYSLSYPQIPTPVIPTSVIVGETRTISVQVRNTGSVPIPALWLGLDIRDSNGVKVESTKTPVTDPETGRIGWIDFGGTQGQDLGVGLTRTFTATYKFGTSVTGHSYRSGNYRWEYKAWASNYPPAGTGIGSLQTTGLTINSSASLYLDYPQLNRIPGVTSTVAASTSPLLFPDPVSNPGKFGAIVRIFNPTSKILNGFLEVLQYVTPSGIVTKPIPGLGTDKIGFGDINPEGSKDVFVPLTHDQVGKNWSATIALETGIWPGISVLDEVSVDYEVYDFGLPTYTCVTQTPLWQQLGRPVVAPGALSDEELDQQIVLSTLRLIALLLEFVPGHPLDLDAFPIFGSGVDFFSTIEKLAKDMQKTAVLRDFNKNSSTLSFKWENWSSSEYNVSYAYDRAVITLSVPDTVQITGTDGGSLVHDSVYNKNRVLWIINAVDKQITTDSNNSAWQHHLISITVDDTKVANPYNVDITLSLEIGPFQGIPGTDYIDLQNIPEIYNYDKWCSNPEDVYWVEIASKMLSTIVGQTGTGCKALTYRGGTITPNSVMPGGNYVMSCDFGEVLDCIAPTPPSGNCSFNGVNGTAAVFNCKAGTTLGTFTGYCSTFPTATNACPYKNTAGNLTVSTSACKALTYKGGTITPNSVMPGGNYVMSCDFGQVVDCVAPTEPSGHCTFSGFNGTAAIFNCTAGTTSGTFTGYCGTFPTATNYCSYHNSAGNLTVSASGCKALTYRGGTITPNSVMPGGNYVMSCDFGQVVDCVAPTEPSGHCTFSGFNGTAAIFNCTAGTTSGTFTGYCGTFPTATNYCSYHNSAGNLTVSASGCKALTYRGGTITPNSVVPGGNYVMSCDFGELADCVTPTEPSGDCRFSGFDGTAAIFNCTAGTTAGTFTGYCGTFPTATNYCSYQNSAGSLTILP